MEPKLNIRSIVLLLTIVIVNTAHTQQLFYCDSVFNNERRQFEGVCKEFYEFTKCRIDSIVEKEHAKIYWGSVPVKIVAPVNLEMKIQGIVYGIIRTDTLFKIDFVNGVPDGYYIRFCGNDTLSVTQFQNGLKSGLQRKKSICGSTTFIQTTYLNDVEKGPYLVIDNGEFRGLTAFLNGERHGAQYRLDENGTLEWLLVYENGKVKDGTYYHFDESGKIIQADTYKKGKLRKTIKYYDDEPPKVTRYK